MKKVISFSGGRTSAYTVLKALVDFGTDDTEIVLMDTGAEHPKTYEFIRQFADYLKMKFNKDITALRLVINPEKGKGNTYKIIPVSELQFDLAPFKAMLTKYGVPYIGGMFCTDRMKLKVFKSYCDETYGQFNYETWLGIRADEPKRYWGDHKQKKYSPWRILSDLGYDSLQMAELYREFNSNRLSMEWVSELVGCDKFSSRVLIKRYYEIQTQQEIHYLAEISDFEKEDVLEFWSKMPFDLGIPEWLGNCVFCPKKSDLKLAAAFRDEPELYKQWTDMIKHPSVRVDNKTGRWDRMYRGKSAGETGQALHQIIEVYSGSTDAEIKQRIKGGKMLGTGSCSESCEVFGCTLDAA